MRCSESLIGFFLTWGVTACATGSVADDTVETTTAATTASSGVGGNNASSSSSATTTSTSSGTATSGSGTGGSGQGECGPKESDIFLISKTNELHRFEPKTGSLNKIGPLMCPVVGGVTPVSITVDRDEGAWVVYNDGRLYKVSTMSAACTGSGFVPSQQGFKTFSMAFVANTPGGSPETLTIANTVGIGTIDVGTLKVTPHGSFGGSQTLQLTGAAKGALFGFFPSSSAYLSPIDPQTSTLGAHQKLDAIKTTGTSAFAQWGGSFWFFTAPIGTSSRIDRYDPVSKLTEPMNPSVGFEIIAAGVSTCATASP